MLNEVIKYIIYFVAWVITAFGGSLFVKTLMKPFHIDDLPKGFDNAGKYIGIIERTLILILLLMDKWSLIGFLITMKAIYRFGDISGDNKIKMRLSEYFLIGTLLSLLWVLLVFIILRWILALI